MSESKSTSETESTSSDAISAAVDALPRHSFAAVPVAFVLAYCVLGDEQARAMPDEKDRSFARNLSERFALMAASAA
jgi:hypothetical protein